VPRVSTPAPGVVNGVAAANVSLPNIRVLIADDSSLFRDGLSNLVSAQKDLHVAGTVDGAATANEQIRLLRPDIVLLGWSASAPASQRIFAAIQDGKLPTRIIMMVTDDGKEDLVEAIRLGCSGIVPKTTSTELLLKSIRKVHAGEIWLDRMSTADVIRRLSKKGGGNVGARQGLREQGAALSTREREIVGLIAQGFKNKDMAERLFISEQTVKNHLHNIFDKLGVSDRLELALYAIHHKLHDGA
jgi:two-component system, NarL family, nitrate/nitrite response regulator NarL